MPMTEAEFDVQGTSCKAWLYEPAVRGPHPVVVLAHGVPGTHALYWKTAEAYCQAGYAVLDFDNRCLGTSGGQPRQIVNVKHQIEDLRAAIAFARSLPTIDASRVVLYGSSFGGGVATEVAATDPDIAAVVLVVPMVDGPTNLPGTPVLALARTTWRAWRDRARRAVGRAPLLAAVFGPDGGDALIARDGVWDTLQGLVPAGGQWDPNTGNVVGDGSEFRNEAGYWELAMSTFWRPGRRLAQLRGPVLLLSGDNDRVCPPGPQRRFAKRNPAIQVVGGEFNHFDPFLRQFDDLTARQLDFLAMHVPLAQQDHPQPESSPSPN